MNDSPLKPASSRRKKMDKTMMAIYFLILFIVAGAALLAFLCLSKPSDKKNNAGSDPSIASSSTLKNSHQIGTDAKSTAKAKIKEEKPVDPYENLAVANVDDALNLRENQIQMPRTRHLLPRRRRYHFKTQKWLDKNPLRWAGGMAQGRLSCIWR